MYDFYEVCCNNLYVSSAHVHRDQKFTHVGRNLSELILQFLFDLSEQVPGDTCLTLDDVLQASVRNQALPHAYKPPASSIRLEI
jgi:hypothetical protein